MLAYPFGIACSSCKPPFKGGNSGLGCKNQARYFNCPQIDGVRIRLSKYWQEANHSLKKILIDRWMDGWMDGWIDREREREREREKREIEREREKERRPGE